MSSTITIPSGIGEASTEVANNAAARGDETYEIANAVIAVATAAKTDIEAAQAGTTVTGVNGTAFGAGGALTTGNAPYVSGVAATTYSALNLAGGSGWVTGILPAANVVQQVRAATGVVVVNVATLSSFTVADAAGENDGNTYAEGDVVLLVNQTTAAQDGPYVVGVVATGTAPLTRPSWWAAASVQPAGVIFAVQAGTFYALSQWKATTATAITVGTTPPAFYPQTFRQTITLASGTYKIGFGSTATPDEPLFLLSTTRSTVNITRDTVGGTLTGTVMYACPVTTRVAGKAGTANIVINSVVEAGTLQNQDNSTLSVLVTNW